MSIDQTPPARNRPLTGDAVRWAAARDEYLAGSPAEAVCRRHDLRLATFRRRALREGWRRMDQPAPVIAPDAPDLAPAVQNDPLVIPDAPTGASRDAPPVEQQAPPLTAAQMVETCWSHIQTAVAAGRVIEARNWMRLYKDLKPFACDQDIAAARPAWTARLLIKGRSGGRSGARSPSGKRRQAGSSTRTLHFRRIVPSLRNLTKSADDDPPGHPDDPDAAGPSPATDLLLLRHPPRTRGAAGGRDHPDEATRSPVSARFSPPESHHPGQGP